MSKSKNPNDKTFENTANPQQKIVNANANAPLGDVSASIPHSVKKEALGPNTKRK